MKAYVSIREINTLLKHANENSYVTITKLNKILSIAQNEVEDKDLLGIFVYRL